MFNKGDKVIHADYGTGVVWRVVPTKVLKYKDKNNKLIYTKGVIEVAFDSEMGENDGNGSQKTVTFLPDGREHPIGFGYFWNGVFNQLDDSIQLTKI